MSLQNTLAHKLLPFTLVDGDPVTLTVTADLGVSVPPGTPITLVRKGPEMSTIRVGRHDQIVWTVHLRPAPQPQKKETP